MRTLETVTLDKRTLELVTDWKVRNKEDNYSEPNFIIKVSKAPTPKDAVKLARENGLNGRLIVSGLTVYAETKDVLISEE